VKLITVLSSNGAPSQPALQIGSRQRPIPRNPVVEFGYTSLDRRAIDHFSGCRCMEEPDYGTLAPLFARMRDYLARVAPHGRLPGRQHIDPIDLREVLALINLAEVVRESETLRFRFRLVGTMQTTMAGREITGKFIEDAVLPQFVDRIRTNMRAAVERKVAIYDRFEMPHPHRTFIDTERIYYPLAADGETVDMLLILNHYP
jgi:hypothetical protein